MFKSVFDESLLSKAVDRGDVELFEAAWIFTGQVLRKHQVNGHVLVPVVFFLLGCCCRPVNYKQKTFGFAWKTVEDVVRTRTYSATGK